MGKLARNDTGLGDCAWGGRMISAPTKGNVGAFFERPRANTVRPYEGKRIATGTSALAMTRLCRGRVSRPELLLRCPLLPGCSYFLVSARKYAKKPTWGLPVAVPGVRLGGRAPALHTDRSHSLRSLHPPPAALLSLPLPQDPLPARIFGRLRNV